MTTPPKILVALYKPAGPVYDSECFQPKEGEPLFINPATLSDGRRTELLNGIEANEILALRFAAKVFGESPNHNGIRPRPGTTHEIADTAPSTPFISDHSLHTTKARNGEVVDSKMVRKDVIDLLEMRSKSGMESLVRNNLGEFSVRIGFEEASCSKCGTPAAGWWWLEHDCDCEVGSKFKSEETGKREIVELWTDGNFRIEVSNVNLGAFPNTGIVSKFENIPKGESACFSYVPQSDQKHQHQLTGDYKMPEDDKTSTQAESVEVESVPTVPASVENSEPTELETLRALYAKSEADKTAAQNEAFNSIFNEAVKDRKMLPKHRAHQAKVFSSTVFGSNAVEYRSHVKGLDVLSGMPTKAIGSSSNEMEGVGEPDKGAKTVKSRLGRDISSEYAEAAVKFGYVSPESFNQVFVDTEAPKPPRTGIKRLFGR